MKIQLISNEKRDWNKLTLSSLNAPVSLDVYDINIIDMQSSSIWQYVGNNCGEVSCKDDLKSIKIMLEQSSASINIIVMPQNIEFYYDYGRKERSNNAIISTVECYRKCKQLKDMLSEVSRSIMINLIPHSNTIMYVYERNETVLSNEKFVSSFYIYDSYKEVLSESEGSKKVTTAVIESNLILTTLDILESEEKLFTFLRGINILEKEKENAPNWINEISFLDDDMQRQLIEDKTLEIKNAKKIIQNAEEKLCENMKYKSILYTNGEELVKVVFDILEQILDCDLSEFVDKNLEDFLIRKEGVTFIGEIKGITSNVKSENISQLDTHYYEYLDKLEEEGKEENVKQILIINPLRSKPLQERQPVHDKQKELAQRNQSLIIETKSLLRIYETFQKGEISAEKIIGFFATRSGLLEWKDLMT